MQEPKLTVHKLCYIIIKVQGSRFGRDFFPAVPTRSQNNPAKQNFVAYGSCCKNKCMVGISLSSKAIMCFKDKAESACKFFTQRKLLRVLCWLTDKSLNDQTKSHERCE